VPTSSAVVLDLAAGYPDLGVLRACLTRRDWAACRATLDAATPDRRTGLIQAGTDEHDEGLEEFLRDTVRRDPSDGAAVALLGSQLIGIGWDIRTSARATNVSAEQFRTFHEWLDRAEQVLIEGAARFPHDPAIWTLRLTSAMGLELGQAEARRRYGRLAAIAPHHLPAQSALVQQLCPKWGGSWEELHTFARDAMRAAPAGTAHGGLVADAHAEHLLAMWTEDSWPERREYLHSPVVRDELFEAARRSIGDPSFRRGHGWLMAASTFAFLFWLMQEKDATAWAFRLLGGLATEYPWHVFRNVPDAVNTARAWALAES
jgi:hypothetical protein